MASDRATIADLEHKVRALEHDLEIALEVVETLRGSARVQAQGLRAAADALGSLAAILAMSDGPAGAVVALRDLSRGLGSLGGATNHDAVH